MKRRSNILWRHSGDNVLLFSLKTGSLWRLNFTGGRIWELLDGEYSEIDINKIITEEFSETSQEKVQEGLNSFMDELKKRDLIEN